MRQSETEREGEGCSGEGGEERITEQRLPRKVGEKTGRKEGRIQEKVETLKTTTNLPFCAVYRDLRENLTLQRLNLKTHQINNNSCS